MKRLREDELDLQELFDTTAAAPDARALERLERAAGAAPAAPRPPRRPARGLWAAALLAAAAGTTLLWRMATPARPEPSEAIARSVRPPALSEPGALSSREVTVAPEDEAQTLEDEGTDVLDDLALDPGDLTDAELDTWISAAGSTLDG
jgi:hypothetical protein